MGDLFKALSSGLARFVYAWLMPSIITAGVFVLIDVPQVSSGSAHSPLTGAAAFTLAVLGLSVVFAYASRPIYQFLEGYTMPAWMAKPLLRQSQRRFLRLKAIATRGPATSRQFAVEALKSYPDSLEMVMPTRLGNSLKAMESYGVTRYGLDSQTFWYELQAVADVKVSQSTEETRSAVDFFMSSVAHLSLLSGVSVLLVPFADNPLPVALVALVALGLVPCAYLQAVSNVGEWRWAVQALVNTSRPALARALSLTLPDSYRAEHEMWQSVAGFVHYGVHDDYLRVLDPRRASAPALAAVDATNCRNLGDDGIA